MIKPKVLSAGVIVVRREGGQWLYLLLRAYRYWDFPKGIVEPGEEPLEAARREVQEETTITDLDFRWGLIYKETGPYNNGRKIARYYIAETRTSDVSLPISPELGRPEHDEFRWLPFEEARKLTAPRVREALEWANRIITSGNKETVQKRRKA